MKRKQQKLRQQVDEFNARHKVGTAVDVTKDGGEKVRTVTTSQAWVLGGHSPVITLDGISGCYSLERVRAAA